MATPKGLSAQDQLEIINPAGDVVFKGLDMAAGITNIGQHPENDIVIASPDVAPFHAIIDHRQKPYRLVTLTDEPASSLGGGGSVELHNFDTFQIGGYTLILFESEGAASNGHRAEPAGKAPLATGAAGALAGGVGGAVVAPIGQASPGGAQAPTGGAAEPRAASVPVTPRSTLPADIPDDLILVESAERTWLVDPEAPGTMHLTITNGGPLVATFNVMVEGLDPSWVEIEPPEFNLKERARANVVITVKAPRRPTSTAGPHHFAVIVTSEHYPGHRALLGATLSLNPYYEYAVSELSPRQMSVSYRKHTARATYSIVNKGNSPARYQVEGSDDEKGVQFEFNVPGEDVRAAKQAQVLIEPNATMTLPIDITPNARPLFALMKKYYTVNVTTTPLNGQMAPRMVMGMLYSSPLIGKFFAFLVLVFLAGLIVFIFYPRIQLFGADRYAVKAGQPVVLNWNAWPPVGSWRIEPDIGALDGPRSSRVITPMMTAKYTLVVENFLSPLNPGWFTARNQLDDIVVDPVFPVINKFDADRKQIWSSEEVTVYWDVVSAKQIVLTTNGAPETIDMAQSIGQKKVALNQNTTFVLEVANDFPPPVRKSLEVKVDMPPTPTTPPPVIVSFDVQPRVITAGQSVQITWKVTGVESVDLSDGLITSKQTPEGNVSQTPQKTTTYVLIARTGGQERTLDATVVVNPAPTPTPTPVPAKIEFFTATPAEVVKGSMDANNVQLSWSIVGTTTNVELSGPDFPKISNLASVGKLSVSVSKNPTVFVLTVYQGDQAQTMTAEVKVLDPTPTPPPPPTLPPPPTSTPTPTPVPPARINYFLAKAADDSAVVNPLAASDVPSDTSKFEVAWGSNIVLSWEAVDAAVVVLGTYGAQPAKNDAFGPITVKAPMNINLSGANSAGATVNRFVIIQLQPKPVPPAPYGVNGLDGGTAVTLTWQYDGNYQKDIIGFRVYRANVGTTDYVMMVNEDTLNALATLWSDTSVPVCGKSYYVAAVYTDINGNKQQTSPGSPSWASQPCSAAQFQLPAP